MGDWYYSVKMRHRFRGRRVLRVPCDANGTTKRASCSSRLARRLPRDEDKRCVWPQQDKNHKRFVQAKVDVDLEFDLGDLWTTSCSESINESIYDRHDKLLALGGLAV